MPAPNQAQQIRGLQEQVRRLRTRIPLVPDPVAPDDLIWRDTFLSGTYPGPNYANSFGLFESLGSLTWDTVASYGGWFEFVTKAYNTMQALTLTTPSVEHEGDPPQGFARIYVRTNWTPSETFGTGIRLHWDFTGPLTIEYFGPDGVTEFASVGFEPEPATQYVLAFAVQNRRLYGAVISTTPDLVIDASDILATVEYDLPVDDFSVWTTDRRVAVFVGQYVPWSIQEYAVWKF